MVFAGPGSNVNADLWFQRRWPIKSAEIVEGGVRWVLFRARWTMKCRLRATFGWQIFRAAQLSASKGNWNFHYSNHRLFTDKPETESACVNDNNKQTIRNCIQAMAGVGSNYTWLCASRVNWVETETPRWASDIKHMTCSTPLCGNLN